MRSSDLWVTAVADGYIVRAGDGSVVQDLDNDGYEQTGWTVLYMHIDSNERVEAGAYVYAGDRIGHPSCEGGISNATHLHIARRYNGEWIPADGNSSLCHGRLGLRRERHLLFRHAHTRRDRVAGGGGCVRGSQSDLALIFPANRWNPAFIAHDLPINTGIIPAGYSCEKNRRTYCCSIFFAFLMCWEYLIVGTISHSHAGGLGP
jgi:murein DD-endopeptidase MepM/ murein hydrolase activator NlpD